MKILKMSWLIIICIVIISIVLTSNYASANTFHSAFDLNNDKVINLSDLSILSNYLSQDDQASCYSHYYNSLPVMSSFVTSTAETVNLQPGVWCSVLMGILDSSYNEAGIITKGYNQIVDVNSDQSINLSDFSIITDWYNNNNDQACFARFVNTYNYSNYESVDWCNGLYHGIANFYSTQNNNVDITVESISNYPVLPKVNESVIITVHGRNSGNTTLTSTKGILNFYKSFQNFEQTELAIPSISVNDPLEPGDPFYIRFSGKFTSVGEKVLSFNIDNANELEESNENNNVISTRTSVTGDDFGTDSLLDINDTKVSDITTNSAKIYWKASVGSNGEYRYAKSGNDINQATWWSNNVENNPDVTGNMFASTVVLTGLENNTEYNVDVKKYYINTNGDYLYGDIKRITFSTKDDLDILELKVENVTYNSAKIYWKSSIGSNGEYRYAKSGNDINQATWWSNNVENNPDVTGNMFASTVVLNNLEPATIYDVEVKKYHINTSGDYLYGDTASARFVTDEADNVLVVDNIDRPMLTRSNVDTALTNRLRGKILLQVENHGEAWYVKPDTGTRMYMKDGDTAYGMMRNLGLGITNTDLAKIPIGFENRFECLDSDNDGLCDKLEDGLGTDKYKADSDGDGYNDGTEVKNNYNPSGLGNLSYDNSLTNRLKGQILLQVQAHGEAWYINPDDGKRYYMPDGSSAYQIMRYLSLGITNTDLGKIAE